MSAGYEVAAYAMRYWFIFLTVGILIAVIYISYKEFKNRKAALQNAEKYSGYLEIVAGPNEFLGDRFGLLEKNSIGSGKKCDIILPDDSVLKTHALIYLEDGEYYLSPMDKKSTLLNGRKTMRAHKLKTGDVVSIGEVDLRIYIKRVRLDHDI